MWISMSWLRIDDEWPLVARKRGGSRLVFALLLKSYGRHGRFLSGPETVSAEIVDFVARRVGVSASSLAGYDWLGRTHRYHQAQIREYFGYRACSVADAEDLTAWLASAVCERERDAGRVRAETRRLRTSMLRPTFLPKLLAVNPPWMRFSKSSTCAKLLAGSADLLRASSGRSGPGRACHPKGRSAAEDGAAVDAAGLRRLWGGCCHPATDNSRYREGLGGREDTHT